MGSPMQYVESDRQTQALELAVQLMRLVDGHLLILTSMQQEQRRVRPVDMKDRACQHRQLPLSLGLATEQETQSRFPNAQPARRGLVQNRQQVARSEVRDDCMPEDWSRCAPTNPSSSSERFVTPTRAARCPPADEPAIATLRPS